MTTTKQEAFRLIANKIAALADNHARDLRADEDNRSEEVTDVMTRAREAAEARGEDGWDEADAAKEKYLDEQLAIEMEKLKSEAASYNINLEPAFLEALVPAIVGTTYWMSSSAGC